MHRHAFRSVCSRARPELEQASDALRSCIRQFSTTQLQAADGKGPSDAASGSPHSRSRNAASEINSLARSRSPARGDQATSGPAGAPRVLDVKSLPRTSFRGRGGFRGRGARGGQQGDGPSYRGGRGGYGGEGSSFRGRGGYGGEGSFRGRGGYGEGSSFRGRGAFGGEGSGFRGRGGFGGRGSRGGFGARGARGGRGGRGGRGRGGRGRGGRRQEGEDKERKPRVNEDARLDADEQAFDDSIRFGVATQFDPCLTLESLADYAPVAPTSSAGKSAAVLQNLSVLGTADHVGAPQAFQARHYATEIEAGGMRYFADAEARAAAEKHLQKNKPALPVEGEGEGEGQAAKPFITDAEEAVRKVVLEKAVMGQHETPKFAMDPVGLSRSWHLRAETYTINDVNTFENKLTSLLAKRGGKPAAKPKAQA
ncbi:hypothetical protein B0J13DRAFT_618938 [Dactylonectria estremocensis]|uniref:Uncharacterized protein n=1 Tax=Dactylonectria estremocensis TaxID=1079267 RepID=A0A9P9F7E3_9HYPO|nr:hypothetical protein B0J13DRAFT_618938 [Dactylonectria estremocensis]